MLNLSLIKKFIRGTFGIMSLTLLFVGIKSCQSNEEGKFNPMDKSIQARFAICKDIAAYHSGGLEFVYNQLKGQKNIQRISGDVEHTFIKNAIIEYMSQEKVRSRMEQFENQICLETKSILRSDNQEIPEYVVFIINILENILEQDAIESAKSVIYQALASSTFGSFSETEQNEILLLFAIFIDSVDYWSENLAYWDAIDEETDILRSGGEEETYLGGGEQTVGLDIKRLLVIGVCDVQGAANQGYWDAFKYGLGGAAVGLLGGTLATVGMGAATGAIGGYVAGGIQGAVDYSAVAAKATNTDEKLEEAD